MEKNKTSVKGLMERLNDGEFVICSEGYLFEFERRGYLKAGHFCPEVVVEHPDMVRQLHRDFVHAGSDVVLAFTYYVNAEKLKLAGRSPDELENMNRSALRIAREVADETNTLMAGDISNSNTFNPNDPESIEFTRKCFEDQITWATEEGADYIVAETFTIGEEAVLALDVLKKCGKGLPCVVTIPVAHSIDDNGKGLMAGSMSYIECLKLLEKGGADIVGFNCYRGPQPTIEILMEAQKAGIQVPLAAVPVPFRTTHKEPNMLSLTDPLTGKRSFPTDLDCHLVTRQDIYDFGVKCKELGVNYIGICCGGSPQMTRVLAESIGRKPPASKYSPDMKLHCLFGTDNSVHSYMKSVRKYVTNK